MADLAGRQQELKGSRSTLPPAAGTSSRSGPAPPNRRCRAGQSGRPPAHGASLRKRRTRSYFLLEIGDLVDTAARDCECGQHGLTRSRRLLTVRAMVEADNPHSWRLLAGYGPSFEAVASVAAPLLAAGGAALLGVVAADYDKFRWPGQALVLVAAAVLLFVACVQTGFRTRRYLYSLADIQQWGDRQLSDDELTRLKKRRQEDLRRWKKGTQRSRALYILGVVALGVGAAMVVAPPEGVVEGERWRWAGCWMLVVAAGFELLWALVEWTNHLFRHIQQRRTLRAAHEEERANGSTSTT